MRSLTNVKAVRMVAAVLLALVFQLAWLPLHASQPGSCPGTAAHCGCCDDLPFCSCAADDNPAPQAPAWPVPPDSGIKLPQLRPVDCRVMAEFSAIEIPVLAPRIAVFPQAFCGYRGVKTAVAFCSFLM